LLPRELLLPEDLLLLVVAALAVPLLEPLVVVDLGLVVALVGSAAVVLEFGGLADEPA
jgi:hypothetical protein